MDLLVRAFPIQRGKEDQMRRFVAEAQGPRGAELLDFYERMGVARESWHLQETEHGPWMIGVTEMADRPLEEAAHHYAGSQHPFDAWFKRQIAEITGIDPEQTPLGPPSVCVFDTQRAQAEQAEQAEREARRSGVAQAEA